MAPRKEPVPKEPKADEMLVQSGMRFAALKDCHIGRYYKEGEEVDFAPGQMAPLNLVRLVAEDAAVAADAPASELEAQADIPADIPADAPAAFTTDAAAEAGSEDFTQPFIS